MFWSCYPKDGSQHLWQESRTCIILQSLMGADVGQTYAEHLFRLGVWLLLFVTYLGHALSVNTLNPTWIIFYWHCTSLCLFRNLVSIRELLLILGTVMLSRSSLDSQQLPGWFVWGIILTQSPRLFLWIHIDSQSFAFSSPSDREEVSQHTSPLWLYSPFSPFHVFPGSFLYCPKSTRGHSSYFEENLLPGQPLKRLRNFFFAKIPPEIQGLNWQFDAIFHTPTERFSNWLAISQFWKTQGQTQKWYKSEKCHWSLWFIFQMVKNSAGALNCQCYPSNSWLKLRKSTFSVMLFDIRYS